MISKQNMKLSLDEVFAAILIFEYISSLMKNNKSIKLIQRDKEKSLPLSILDGIKSSQFDNVMWLDADGSMTVKAMKKLVVVILQI